MSENIELSQQVRMLAEEVCRLSYTVESQKRDLRAVLDEFSALVRPIEVHLSRLDQYHDVKGLLSAEMTFRHALSAVTQLTDALAQASTAVVSACDDSVRSRAVIVERLDASASRLSRCSREAVASLVSDLRKDMRKALQDAEYESNVEHHSSRSMDYDERARLSHLYKAD